MASASHTEQDPKRAFGKRKILAPLILTGWLVATLLWCMGASPQELLLSNIHLNGGKIMKSLEYLVEGLTIETWALDRLVPYARNARAHSATQISQIAESVKSFGFTNPVLAGPDGDIVAGHGRVLAAHQLGMTQVPVIILRHLSESQKRALRIADNQIALNAGWNFEMLRLELASLVASSVNLDLVGFTDEQLKEVLRVEVPLPRSDPDFIPEADVDEVSQPGDMWELGKHRLLCGDGRLRENLGYVLGGRPCHMVFADPPYSVSYTGKGPGRLKIANDDLGAEFENFLSSACKSILAVAQGAVYIAMASTRLHELQRAFVDAGGHFSTYIIWAKTNFTLGRADYQRQFEPLLYGWPEGKSRHWCGARDQGDVWFFSKPFRNDLHPTMKPVELLSRAISNSSRPGNVVLDPFGGAGSTLLACENLGRAACLVEILPKYVDCTIRRWERYTNRRANLSGTAKSFDEIARERKSTPARQGGAK
jgi:DNA modification methylase